MAFERKVVKAGYLIKSPPQEKLMAQWHRRYFILWSTKLIEYYTSHEHKPQDYLKTIDLRKCVDMVAPIPIAHRAHVIKLSVQSGEKLRDYFLDCGTEVELNQWVKCLANVCGFCPVQDEGDDNQVYSSPAFEEDQPIYHDIPDQFTNIEQSLSKPGLHPPLPPPKLKSSFSHDDLDQLTYEEPVTCTDLDNNNYHLLQENSGSLENSVEDKRSHSEEWYDDVGINDAVVYTMNKTPPPVWRPEFNKLRKTPPLPPDRRAVSSGPVELQRKSLNLESLSTRRNLPVSKPPTSLANRSKPLPPPKCKPDSPSSNAIFNPQRGGGGMFGVKNDPKFQHKLHEKRQELYGASAHKDSLNRGRSFSMGGGEEYYESVLFTVDDVEHEENAEHTPQLPPKTETMLREQQQLSPPPPPLPSRDIAPSSTGYKQQPLPSRDITPSSTGYKQQRVTMSPSRQMSPLHQVHEASSRLQPLPSPQHRGKGTTTSTSPPPLPSRELLNPHLPSYDPSLVPDSNEEAPPPVPLRQSSNRPQPITSFPQATLSPQKRRNSLPPSPTPIKNDRFKQLGTHKGEILEPQSFTHALAQIVSSFPKSPSRSSKPPQPLVESAEVYDDVTPQQQPYVREMYDDTQNLSTGIDGCSIAPIIVHQNSSSPSRVQQKPTWTQSNPQPGPIPQPRSRNQQRDRSPVAPKSTEMSPRQSRQNRVNNAPPLPPNKPQLPDPSATRVNVGRRVHGQHFQAPSNPGGRGPTEGQGQNKPKPMVSKKPPVTRKPPPAKTTNKPLVSRKPPPPTQPKPTKNIPDSTNSSPSHPSSVNPPFSLATRHKPKPMVPKKPITSISS